jgi:hypothetical protein
VFWRETCRKHGIPEDRWENLYREIDAFFGPDRWWSLREEPRKPRPTAEERRACRAVATEAVFVKIGDEENA